jgi:TctA family transporter
MTISQGDVLIFVQKPLSLGLLMVAAVAVLGPVVWRAARGAERRAD